MTAPVSSHDHGNCALCDQIEAALDALMQLIDDGLLVRSTTNDEHWPSYLAEATRLVTVLNQVKAVRP